MAPTAATNKQVDLIITLANRLTGRRARYTSQLKDVVSEPRGGWGKSEASALIDELEDAITAHAKWQEETGLTVGARLRHHYTTGKGVKIIAEGPITGYTWTSDFQVAEVVYDATPETRRAAGFREEGKTIVSLERLGARAADDPVAELEAERARLLARVAEIDAQLAGMRG